MKMFCFAAAVLMLSGCSNELYNLMERTSEPPVESKPEVSSFLTPLELHLTWDADEGADEYFIYRDTSPSGSFNQLMYNGTATSYTDSHLTDNFWYYYKLTKRRGKEIFTPTLCGCGIATMTQEDMYEPNNTKQTATPFPNAIVSNIYFYQDGTGNSIEDVDWYSVTVGARTRYTLMIDTFDNLVDEDITFNLESQPVDTVVSGEEYSIGNYEYVPRTFYFQIAVNRGKFVTDPFSAGGKIGSYRIKFMTTTDVEG